MYLPCQQAPGLPQSRPTCRRVRSAGPQTTACQPKGLLLAARLQKLFTHAVAPQDAVLTCSNHFSIASALFSTLELQEENILPGFRRRTNATLVALTAE